MYIEQQCWRKETGWEKLVASPEAQSAQLVLVFGSNMLIKENSNLYQHLRTAYPDAKILGCATVIGIGNEGLSEDIVIATALCFNNVRLEVARTALSRDTSYDSGKNLATKLARDDLAHVIVFSDGLMVNGPEFVRGLSEHLPESVSATGGMAGTHGLLQDCYIIDDDELKSGMAIAVGFYGNLTVGYGSYGGWDSFGPERKITRADGHIIYEIDGRSSLDLYKEYLGERAKELPESAILFPLLLKRDENGFGVVRAVLGVDEKEGSLIFAGNMPKGAYVRLMKANINRLISGVERAAELSMQPQKGAGVFALAVSCVGRMMVLKKRTDEEYEAARTVMGDAVVIGGFYSFGEICPGEYGGESFFHNETMTITTFCEE